MTNPALVEVYDEAARRLGASLLRLPDGHGAVLSHRGASFGVWMHDDDPEFLHLTLAYRRSPGSSLTLDQMNQLAQRVSITSKGAFVIMPDRDTVQASAEMVVAARDCLPTVEHLTAVLPRATDMLVDAVNAFIEALADVSDQQTAWDP